MIFTVTLPVSPFCALFEVWEGVTVFERIGNGGGAVPATNGLRQGKKEMYNCIRLLMLFFLAAAISSCGQLNKAQSGAGMGAAGGAIIGQAIGHNTGATLIGAAVGTMVGYMVGNEMDKYDSQQLGLVYERGIPGQTISWRNPDSGHMHHVTPQPVVRTASGICRTAEIDSVIDGRRETTLATACRDEYGRWILRS